MKYTLSQSGFTLVELAIALCISSILALTAGLLIITANRHFSRGNRQADLQRDLSLIAEIVGTCIRDGRASGSDIYADSSTFLTGPAVTSGHCLKVSSPSGTTTIFYQGGHDFVRTALGGTPQRLVRNVVDTLRFHRDTSPGNERYINLSLSLQQAELRLTSQNRYFFRN